MKLAFVYAGQGSQHVGMGKDLYETYPVFQKVLDEAPVDFDLKKLCFEGPEEMLSLTQYTQPSMVAFAIGMTKLFAEKGIRPEMAAGLSLGEYSALAAAGVFDEKTAISLAAFRGKAMTKAAEGFETGMFAVLGMEEEPLRAVCAEASTEDEKVELANLNCPGQIVISGAKAAVERAGELALSKGAKRCLPLKVSGPFHTSYMAPAGEALRERFLETEFSDMAFPVLFNATGETLKEGETVSELLVKQVQSSVYFEKTLLKMEEAGVDTIVEIGPGKVLSGFVRKTCRDIRTLSVEDVPSFQKALEALKGENA